MKKLSLAEQQVAWKNFTLMRQSLASALEARLQATSGVSSADFQILLALGECPTGKLRGKDMVAVIGWEKSRISHQVSRMESRGLVEKCDCDDDARAAWITLTEKGRELREQAIEAHQKALNELFFDALDAQELAAVNSLSTKLVERLKN